MAGWSEDERRLAGHEPDEAKAQIGPQRRRRTPIRSQFHGWLERHPRACAVYAWQYRTRAKTLHRFGQHGPHFMGSGRCSWCGKS